MAQQSSSHVSSLRTPARENIGGETVVGNSSALVHQYPDTQANSLSSASAETFDILRKRFANGEKCKCPENFVNPVRPYKADYTEMQCQICQNVFGRNYD